MPTRLNALLAAIAFAALGCQAKAPSPETKAEPSPAAPVRVSGAGFATPESVLHDTAADVYLVSNINGAPLEKDDNGFVSRLSPDGVVLDFAYAAPGSAQRSLLGYPPGLPRASRGRSIGRSPRGSIAPGERRTTG